MTGIKRQEILNWLAPGSFEARHSSIGDAHAKHTGTWLLKELELWFGGGGERVVFCIGAGNVLEEYDCLIFQLEWERPFCRMGLRNRLGGSLVDIK